MNRISSRVRLLAVPLAALLIGACSSGGSVNIGGGQSTDPGTVDFPIAYVKRTIPMKNGALLQDDVREVRDTIPDADLFFRNRASPSSTEVNITDRVTHDDPYDIKDVDVSPDGKKIVFAMRGPLATNQKEKDPPDWAIWEYDIPSDTLHRVITSDTVANAGNDVAPQYLPDGRIVFSSTRQRQSQAILRDEGKPGFEAQTDSRNESAFVLHVMKPDGTDINQISFNQSHDLAPSVLMDGRIVFSRWDGATGRGFNLYTANPDGTGLQLLYGARSHMTGTPDADGNPSQIQFTHPREMQNGKILALVRPFTDTDLGGDLTIIDTNTYVENTQPLAAYSGMTGPAQTRATPNEVSTIPGPSRGGRFRSAFPLWDGTNRILVSWSQCRLLDTTTATPTIVPCTDQRLADPNVQTAPPLYSAFMFDPADNTFKPLFEPVEGVMITDLVAAQPRQLPAVRLDHSISAPDFNPSLVGDGVGVLDIRSVYDFDGTDRAAPDAPNIATLADPAQRTADQRRARFLRLEKAVSIGDKDLGFPDIDRNAAFGASNFMREILGYVPIEPDGSVRVRVPANVAFVISVLDKNGRRIFSSHRAWLQVRPGEIRQCNGCHQAATGNALDRSHGRDGTSVSVWAGAAAAATPFPNTLAATAASVQQGDTMAQARARTSCVTGSTCSEIPSVNVAYDDVWTDPTVRPATASFSYNYSGPGSLSTRIPVATSCLSAWNSTCRIVINYEQHIHPLWSVDRGANTCINCHSRTNPVDSSLQLPAGQLDLSGDTRNDGSLHMNAYEQLLTAHDELQLVGGSLVPVTTTTIDPVTGDPVVTTNQVQAPLAAGSANGSTGFFNPFAAGGSHDGRLTPAELRLISEWVDIGAQYFNNPFDPAVPLN